MRTLARRMLGIPLLYKVLIANALIVVFGAVAGTTVTATTFGEQDNQRSALLISAFVLFGCATSIIVNFLVLRAAFQPLDRLAEVANMIRAGDFSKRVRATHYSDPQLARLSESFNATLDTLQEDRDQLRQLTGQVIDAQEQERKRIARELHDDTAQVLFAQLLTVTALKGSALAEVRDVASRLETSTVEAIEGVRRLALELRPPALDDLGLREALADLAQRYSEQSHIAVEYRWNAPRQRLPADLELVLYRIAQEAMTNVLKHSGATNATISVDQQGRDMVLTITDDGRGLDAEWAEQRDLRGLGLGIFGMSERTSLVGGHLHIASASPSGASVIARVPMARASRILHRDTRPRHAAMVERRVGRD